MLGDGAGAPRALEPTGANADDVKRMREALEVVAVERPEWTGMPWGHASADKGYYGEAALESIVLRGHMPRVAWRWEGNAALEKERGKKARRRVEV